MLVHAAQPSTCTTQLDVPTNRDMADNNFLSTIMIDVFSVTRCISARVKDENFYSQPDIGTLRSNI